MQTNEKKLRHMRLDMFSKIREKVKKLFDVGLLIVTKYSEWVANIVLILKKEEKV